MRRPVVGAIVCATVAPWCIACTDRDVTSKTSGTESGSSSSGPMASTGSVGSSTDSAGSGVATTAGSGAQEPYIDCRPNIYDPFTPHECTQTFGADPVESWNSFACNVCLCTERCEQVEDCIDRGAPVPPSCVALPENPDSRLCVLLCEGDDDCPGEMVCLPSVQLADSACFLPWMKPECCDSPDATGC